MRYSARASALAVAAAAAAEGEAAGAPAGEAAALGAASALSSASTRAMRFGSAVVTIGEGEGAVECLALVRGPHDCCSLHALFA
jgi:hypothetical protein